MMANHDTIDRLIASSERIDYVHAGFMAEMFSHNGTIGIGQSHPPAAHRAPGKARFPAQTAIFTNLGRVLFGRQKRAIGRAINGQFRIKTTCWRSHHNILIRETINGEVADGAHVRKALAPFLVIASLLSCSPAVAQVPVNDSDRTTTETETKACMQRARSYKQQTESPTTGIHGSVATPGSAGSVQQAGTSNLVGGALTGTTVGGIDITGLLAVGGSVAALKSNNAGQVINAMAAVSAALAANSGNLDVQGQSIGTVNTMQGAFDQNSAARVSGASLWGQAVQSGTTTLLLRNQQLQDQNAAASASAAVMEYDASKARLVDDDTSLSDNASKTATSTTTLDEIQAELAKAQAAAQSKQTPSTTGDSGDGE